jgi:hypothetical protein
VLFNAALTTGQVYVVTLRLRAASRPTLTWRQPTLWLLGVATSTTNLKLGLIPTSTQK